MPQPFYYVEKDGEWRSMYPQVWLAYVEGMVGYLQGTYPEPPRFHSHGKEILNQPSRVRVTVRPNGKRIYYAQEKHLQVRVPHEEWQLEDWKIELDAVSKVVPQEKVVAGPDIFELVLGS